MRVLAKCTGSFTIVLPKYEFIDGNGFNEVEDTAFLRAQILSGKAVLAEQKEEPKDESKENSEVEEKTAEEPVRKNKRKK